MSDQKSSGLVKGFLDYCENSGLEPNLFEELMADFQDTIRYYQFRIAMMNAGDGTPQGEPVVEEPVERVQEERICTLRREVDKASRVRKDLQRKQDVLQTELDAITPNGEGASEKLNAPKVQIEEIVSEQFGLTKNVLVLCLKTTREMLCDVTELHEIAQNKWIQAQERPSSPQVVLRENFDQLRFMQKSKVVEKLSKMALDELSILEKIEKKNSEMLKRCATTTAPDSNCPIM